MYRRTKSAVGAAAVAGDPPSGATFPELVAKRTAGRSADEAAQMNNLDLNATPVVQTIGRRSLIIGAIVGVVRSREVSFSPPYFSVAIC